MKKYSWILGIAALVIIFGAVALYHKKSVQTANMQPSADQSQAQPAQTSATNSAPVSLKTRSQLYTDAVNSYQYRIQFAQCHGTVTGSAGPAAGGTLVIKKSVSFMIDNRDAVAHTFAFNGQSYKVAGYDFAIVSAKGIGTYPITCDGGGAATLHVEG
jgi:hypothetical protein